MGLLGNVSDISKFGFTGGASALGAGLGGLFGGGNPNPYDSASQFYGQIPDQIKKYFDPYIQQGQRAGGQLEGQFNQLAGGLPGLQQQYGQLINDPNSVMNKIGGQYQASPGYNWQLNQGMNAANNAAAAGGMLGSPQHQQQAAGVAEGLANQDYWNYMNHGLNLYGAGLQGNQGLYNTGLSGLQNMNTQGYNASNELGGGIANSLMNQGNLAYSGQAAENQSRGSMWGDLFGGLGGLAAFGGFL